MLVMPLVVVMFEMTAIVIMIPAVILEATGNEH
jgi:hypothetical protein